MQLTAKLLIGALAASLLVGCAAKEPGEAPGAAAQSGKTYTAEDALKIKPKRGGSEGPGPAAAPAAPDAERGK